MLIGALTVKVTVQVPLLVPGLLLAGIVPPLRLTELAVGELTVPLQVVEGVPLTRRGLGSVSEKAAPV